MKWPAPVPFVLPFAFAALAACSSSSSAPDSPVAREWETPAPGADVPAETVTTPDAQAPATPDAPATVLPFTAAELHTLLTERCAPCHTENAAGGMKLGDDFRAATLGVTSTQVPTLFRIAAGDPEASYLFQKIRGTQADVGGTGNRMPPKGPALDDETLARVEATIRAL